MSNLLNWPHWVIDYDAAKHVTVRNVYWSSTDDAWMAEYVATDGRTCVTVAANLNTAETHASAVARFYNAD